MAAQQANFRMEPGSDAMKQRMQAMMRYNRLRQETRASNAVLQVKRKHQRREAVDPRADENSLERQQMQDRSYYEYGCVTDGLRADLGLERYHEDLANHSASVQESAARPIEEDLEEGEDDDERRREKARRRRKAGMRDIRVHPFEVDELDHRCCRGQMPGWDPYRYSQQMLETEAENMRQLRMSVADNKQTKKLTGTSKITLDLQRPGPTTLTPVDFAKYLARCEGLTLAEWCKEQDVRTERALERERFKITERVKRAEKEAEDPRPDRKQFRDAEVALVAKRCGAGAMRKARNRLGKSMKPSRRARDASSVLGMMLLRSQGFGMVHPEQDVFWIEHELLMAKERIEPRRERLVELGITHILKARPPAPESHRGSFALPRCAHDARRSARSFRTSTPRTSSTAASTSRTRRRRARTTSAASSAWAWRSRPRPWTSAAACSSAARRAAASPSRRRSRCSCRSAACGSRRPTAS